MTTLCVGCPGQSPESHKMVVVVVVQNAVSMSTFRIGQNSELV